MFDIDHIASQVKHNCNISDAKCRGLYSPCGLLLRLRDLYRCFERDGLIEAELPSGVDQVIQI